MQPLNMDLSWRTSNALYADRYGLHEKVQLLRPKDVAAECMSLCTSSSAHLLGFSHISSLAQDILQSIAIQYINKMCHHLKWTMEYCGRAYPTLNDMQLVYERMRIDVDEMNVYVEKVKPLRQPLQVSKFPVQHSTPICMPRRLFQGEDDLPEHIPEWTPRNIDTTLAAEQHRKEATELEQRTAAHEAAITQFPDFSYSTSLQLGISRSMNPKESHGASQFKDAISLYSQMAADGYYNQLDAKSNDPIGQRLGLRSALKRRGSADSQSSVSAKRMTAAGTIPVYDKQLSLNIPSTSSAYRPPNTQLQPQASRFSFALQDRPLKIEPAQNMAVIPPLSLETIQNPPANLEPRRRAQLAVLHHLFSLECNWPTEAAKVFGYIEEGVTTRAGGHQKEGLLSVAAAVADTGTQLAIVKEDKQEWKVTSVNSTPSGMPQGLKIRFSRQTEDQEVDSEPDSNTDEGNSEEIEENSDEERMRKRLKKRKKKKKKRAKERRREAEADADMDRKSESPFEMSVKKTSGLRMKIRLSTTSERATTSRPSSRQSQ